LSGSADVKAFVDATGSAVHIGGWYEYVTKQSKQPDGIAAKLRSWVQLQLGHDAGDVNRPRIDIDRCGRE
ncbi:MAG: hypothetical protein LBK18_00910, partial [Prevotellaceae bacterium]|nr:hypothetical protein [Prevotellaceae bacterium]